MPQPGAKAVFTSVGMGKVDGVMIKGVDVEVETENFGVNLTESSHPERAQCVRS